KASWKTDVSCSRSRTRFARPGTTSAAHCNGRKSRRTCPGRLGHIGLKQPGTARAMGAPLALEHPKPVERGDLAVLRPGGGEFRLRRAQHGDVVEAFACIDDGEIRANRDEIPRHPAPDRPLLGCR